MFDYGGMFAKPHWMERISDDDRSTHLRTIACSGHNVPREAGVVRGEAICDAPVPVPGESVTNGSRVRSKTVLCHVQPD